eukprot:SAG11_NODE_724_length_7524_cov_6.241481_3_plen_345_part_00
MVPLLARMDGLTPYSQSALRLPMESPTCGKSAPQLNTIVHPHDARYYGTILGNNALSPYPDLYPAEIGAPRRLFAPPPPATSSLLLPLPPPPPPLPPPPLRRLLLLTLLLWLAVVADPPLRRSVLRRERADPDQRQRHHHVLGGRDGLRGARGRHLHRDRGDFGPRRCRCLRGRHRPRRRHCLPRRDQRRRRRRRVHLRCSQRWDQHLQVGAAAVCDSSVFFVRGMMHRPETLHRRMRFLGVFSFDASACSGNCVWSSERAAEHGTSTACMVVVKSTTAVQDGLACDVRNFFSKNVSPLAARIPLAYPPRVNFGDSLPVRELVRCFSEKVPVPGSKTAYQFSYR